MVQNPIFRGFPWSQGFDLTAGFLQADDEMYAEFRTNLTDTTALLRIDTSSGIEINGDRIVISLTAAQTSELKQGWVQTNFVVIRAGVDIPIGVIIKIPVALLPSRP